MPASNIIVVLCALVGALLMGCGSGGARDNAERSSPRPAEIHSPPFRSKTFNSPSDFSAYPTIVSRIEETSADVSRKDEFVQWSDREDDEGCDENVPESDSQDDQGESGQSPETPVSPPQNVKEPESRNENHHQSDAAKDSAAEKKREQKDKEVQTDLSEEDLDKFLEYFEVEDLIDDLINQKDAQGRSAPKAKEKPKKPSGGARHAPPEPRQQPQTSPPPSRLTPPAPVPPTAGSTTQPGMDITSDPRANDEIRIEGADRSRETPGWEQHMRGAIKAAKARALAILNKASENLERGRDIFRFVIQRLAYSTIRFPRAGYEFRHCGGDILAFALSGNSRDIYLCPPVLDQTANTKFFAQVLIHEGAHLAGNEDECEASRIEVQAMRESGEGLAFRNIYLDRCGIE